MHTRYLFYATAVFLLAACQGVFAEISASPTGLPVQQPAPATAIPLTPTRTLVPPTSTLTTTPTPEQASKEWKLLNESPHHASPAVVTCETCHGANLEKVEDGQKYCKNCHKDAAVSFDLAKDTKKIHAGLTCLNCHNPHSAEANCTNSGCHESLPHNKFIAIATPEDGHPFQASGDSLCGGAVCHPQATQAALENPTIHGSTHASVKCYACHDASGAPISRSMDTGEYSVVIPHPVATSAPGTPLFHTVTTEVNCSRCHFKDNAWGLPLVSGNEFKNNGSELKK